MRVFSGLPYSFNPGFHNFPMKLSTLFVLGLAAVAPFQGAQAASPKKLLVVTVTTGFRHGPAIDEAENVLPALAEKSGGEFAFEFLSEPGPRPSAGKPPQRAAKLTDEQWAAEQETYKAAEAKAKTDDVEWLAKVKELFAQKLSAEALKGYDGVIFCNTTGELPLPDAEAFANWMKSGKAFVGMHSATDTLKALPAYYEMINGSFAGHPWGAGGTHTFINHEPSHPAVAMFPEGFQWQDEIYQYSKFKPESVRVLLSLNTAQSTPQAPYHVPVSWVRDVGAGRLFYTNLGHNDSTWKNAAYQQHIVAGMRWALKLVDGPSSPNPGVSAETALKGVAGTAASALNKEAAALETQMLAKAKADPQWALRARAEADVYRTLPKAKKDAKPEEIEALAAKKREFLMKLLAEFEK
jgi:type 1 glutamine amidotransferase